MTFTRTMIPGLVAGVICATAWAGASLAGDRVLPPPPGTAPAPVNAASIQALLDAELREKFDAATRHSNHLLTAQGARDAGWGFIADHFAKIDRDQDAALTFGEVQDFIDSRSPLKVKRTKVQVVE